MSRADLKEIKQLIHRYLSTEGADLESWAARLQLPAPLITLWLSGGGLLERGGTVSEQGSAQLSALQGALVPWPGSAERLPAELQQRVEASPGGLPLAWLLAHPHSAGSGLDSIAAQLVSQGQLRAESGPQGLLLFGVSEAG